MQRLIMHLRTCRHHGAAGCRKKPVFLFRLLSLIVMMALTTFSSSAQTITYKNKRTTLEKIFREIRKQTDFVVVYDPKQVDHAATVSVNTDKLPLPDFMRELLKDLPLSFSIVNTTIVVFPTEKTVADIKSAPGSILRIQEPEISGVVLEAGTGQPIANASVTVKETGKGIQTDKKGSFVLKDADEKHTVVISFVGYQTKEMPVRSFKPGMRVILEVATSELDQAVVQAYGITSKRLATGNIARVSGDEIRIQPVSNPLLALEGRVPGMQITPTSGYASAPVKVEIRGRSTLNEFFPASPLYVIDGIAQTQVDLNTSFRQDASISGGLVQAGISNAGGMSPLFGMNLEDIESIEVLKDGDATAIYGSRAANGVILITTKKPKNSKAGYSFLIRQGLNMIPSKRKMLSTEEYLEIRREALRNDGLKPNAFISPDLVLWDTTRYTDWQEELMKVGRVTSASASYSGGDRFNAFRLSANYSKQKSIFNRTGSENSMNTSLNITHRSPNQRLTMDVIVSFMYSHADAINNRGQFNQPPNAPPIFDEKGDLNYEGWQNGNTLIEFPFSSLLIPSESNYNQWRAVLAINYELARGMKLVINSGYNSANGSSDWFQTIASQNPNTMRAGMAAFGSSRNNSWTLEPQLNYTRQICGGSLNLMMGGTYNATTTGGVTSMGTGYSDDDLIRSISNAPFQNVVEEYVENRFASLFARVNYVWGSKYIANVNVRRDGSSRFAPGSRYGNFGSAGVAWIASEEEWVKQLLPSWWSLVKFRASYAITGSDAVGDYEYLSQWSPGGTSGAGQFFNYNGIRPYIPKHAFNQEYHWEEKRKLEAAMNLSFLNDRISLDLAYYRDRCDNQLTLLPTPRYSGFPTVRANLNANIQNAGFEASLAATLVRKKDFSLSAVFNIGLNRNKLLAYPDLERSPYATRYVVGQSLNTRFVLKFLGIDPLTGEPAFEDHNKDGEITVATNRPPFSGVDDRYVSLNLDPRYSGGATLAVQYKRCNIQMNVNFVNKLMNDPLASATPGRMENLYRPADGWDQFWRKPGDQVRYRKFSTIPVKNLSFSDGNFTNGSYIRLNTVALMYSLPDKLVKKAGLKGCQFSVNVQNVYTISRFTGIDPNLTNLVSPPQQRVITSQLSFNF